MENILKVMESNLSESDKRLLNEIYEPTVVSVPLSDARRDIMVMPDGEIRCYGTVNLKSAYDHMYGEKAYLSSRDCGLSWKKIYADKDALCSCVKVPGKEKYITINRDYTGADGNSKVYAYVSEIGPDDTAPKRKEILGRGGNCFFQPVLISGGRWVATFEFVEEITPTHDVRDYYQVVAYSDDDGDNWTLKILDPIERYNAKWPHKGKRWENNGSEPNIVEMPDGSLFMMIRNSHDYFYCRYSYDRGETWTKAEPSPFHGTLTTSSMLRLTDGRVVVFWCNTQPLPEIDHKRFWPPINKDVWDGVWEDAFTNRDVVHAAITEDGGKTWIGFREIGLNEIRNNADFRRAGGGKSSPDKSVHQSQAIELPFNKILFSYGQNVTSRKNVIFDVNWLYEKERHEEFVEGMKNITTHVYVKSICEAYQYKGVSTGHCAWNRTNGALMVPDPVGNFREALQITRIDDPRLHTPLQGATWNFPTMKKGEVWFEMRVDGAGLRVSLTDRWFNACDEYIWYYAQMTCEVDKRCIDAEKWVTIKIDFDTEQKTATVYCDDEKLFDVTIKDDAPNGFSYLHLLTLAEKPDAKGSYIREIHAKAK